MPWVPESTWAKPPPGQRPLRPRHDPFHEPPAGFEFLPPGTILRSREIRPALFGRIPQRIRAWQLLYRTCDLNGTPEATVTTVLLPEEAPEPGTAGPSARPLLAYQCAIDALTDRCFPSYTFQHGARTFGAVPALELLVIEGILRRGWAVSVSDHEGLGGYFAAPREPGYRALDGVRAALAFEPLSLDATGTPVGLLGYSGGGMASAWAAEMAPDYAPELDIVGAALGAPVGDPGETFIRLNGTPHAALPALVVAGLRHLYPGLARVISDHANLDGMRRLRELETLPTVQAMARFRNNDFDDYIDIPLADMLAKPEILQIFDDLRLGQHAPTCPVLVVQSTCDQIIHVDDIDSLVQRYLDAGASVRYLRDTHSDHISLQPLSMPTMLGWMERRFAGRPVSTGTRTVTSVALDPRSWPGYVTMGVAAARGVTGHTP